MPLKGPPKSRPTAWLARGGSLRGLFRFLSFGPVAFISKPPGPARFHAAFLCFSQPQPFRHGLPQPGKEGFGPGIFGEGHLAADVFQKVQRGPEADAALAQAQQMCPEAAAGAALLYIVRPQLSPR